MDLCVSAEWLAAITGVAGVATDGDVSWASELHRATVQDKLRNFHLYLMLFQSVARTQEWLELAWSYFAGGGNMAGNDTDT